MKKFTVVLTILALMIITIPQMATAKDSILNTTIKEMVVRLDKNGNEYVRFTITEDKEIDGVKYKADTALMVFGSLVPEAKAMKEGSPIKAVVNSNEYQGRTNYTLVSLIK